MAIDMKADICKFMIARLTFLTIRLFRYKLYRKSQHILCSVTLFFLKIIPFIRWKNIYRRAGHGRQYNAANV